MSGTLVYLLGQPGSGKSTLVENLTAGLEPLAIESRPFAHIVWPGGVAELGARRPAFSGTDALSMSVQPKVLAWLEEEAPAHVFGEGDRLGNSKFFTAVLGLGWNLTLIRLAVSASVAAARRAQRAHELGTALQSDAWLQGRLTKNRNLVEAWDDRILELDGDQPPGRVLAKLEALGLPLVTLLASQRS